METYIPGRMSEGGMVYDGPGWLSVFFYPLYAFLYIASTEEIAIVCQSTGRIQGGYTRALGI
jgi:hypothetical protein